VLLNQILVTLSPNRVDDPLDWLAMSQHNLSADEGLLWEILRSSKSMVNKK
jgi:hypothetical protein